MRGRSVLWSADVGECSPPVKGNCIRDSWEKLNMKKQFSTAAYFDTSVIIWYICTNGHVQGNVHTVAVSSVWRWTGRRIEGEGKKQRLSIRDCDKWLSMTLTMKERFSSVLREAEERRTEANRKGWRGVLPWRCSGRISLESHTLKSRARFLSA